jgi:hypothetical protein
MIFGNIIPIIPTINTINFIEFSNGKKFNELYEKYK